MNFIAFANEAVTTAAAEQVITADFTGLFALAVPILITLIAGLLYQGLVWITKKIKVEKLVTEKHLQELIDKLIDEASAYAVNNLKNADWLKVKTKHEALGFAMNYVADHGDDLLKKAGLDTNKLQQKIEAKLLHYDPAPGVWEE